VLDEKKNIPDLNVSIFINSHIAIGGNVCNVQHLASLIFSKRITQCNLCSSHVLTLRDRNSNPNSALIFAPTHSFLLFVKSPSVSNFVPYLVMYVTGYFVILKIVEIYSPTLQSRRLRSYLAPKRCFTFVGIRGVISQKI
jgi:hypothetical protein